MAMIEENNQNFLYSHVDYAIESIKDKLLQEKVKYLSSKNIYAKNNY
jgi:hypothetical protein